MCVPASCAHGAFASSSSAGQDFGSEPHLYCSCVERSDEVAPVRLAELVASLSLGIDLGFGQPMEHVLRQCLIGLRLGEQLGLDASERATIYYAALLVNVGCHSDAHEQAKWFGDDIALKASKYKHEPFSARDMIDTVRMIGSGGTPLHRFRTGLGFAFAGYRQVSDMITHHADLARELGAQLSLPPPVLDALGGSYERWDGRGWPGDLAGDAIPIAARVIQLAEFTEVAHRVGGIDAAVALARERRGTQFDPLLVDTMCLDSVKIFGHIDEVDSWDAVIDSEPSLTIGLSDPQCDEALLAISRFVDLKSPFMGGHSLAAAAGRQLDLGEAQLRTLYRAGLVHDFGRLGVSNSIWDKRRSLGPGEWERVRLYPHFTERMLHQSPTLAPLGRIVVQHRERLDGSGYPRGLTGQAISADARILGAADAYQAMREPRPHRLPHTPETAAAELRTEVRRGRLDSEAVEAVLVAAGHRVVRRVEGPSGLTAREVEVLRLVASGLTNKEIAARLVITPKTAGNHVEHIYTKIGTSNRASASLFAMKHGLLPEDHFPD
jgi:HD-GYP domain-containing protein (c-di-GMP phosphodiesterase class II)